MRYATVFDGYFDNRGGDLTRNFNKLKVVERSMSIVLSDYRHGIHIDIDSKKIVPIVYRASHVHSLHRVRVCI